MIHFDFTVDDIDAENIMDCIHTEACRMNEAAAFEEDANKNASYEKHALYLKELMGKMHNKQVGD